jgi:hypothetical protein
MALGEGHLDSAVHGAARRPALLATRRRWQILTEQMRSGHEPCFQTERRHTCGEDRCGWRAECRTARADWLR